MSADDAAMMEIPEEEQGKVPVVPIAVAVVIIAGIAVTVVIIRKKKKKQMLNEEEGLLDELDGPLRMSTSNLKRRKLRTFLTVLGVVIGTASIVVMISLGLGMQQSLYREVEQSGGLTTIKVSGAQAGNSMMYSSSRKEEEQPTKYINDQLLARLSKLEHVTLASPLYELPVVLLKGGYEGNGGSPGYDAGGHGGKEYQSGGRNPAEAKFRAFEPGIRQWSPDHVQ